MKILLFTPTYKRVDGSLAAWTVCLDAIRAMNRGDHAVVEWLSVDEQEAKRQNVVKQYQKARERTIKEKFDALMIVEHDMIPPMDALTKLAAVNAPVVYGVYLFRHGAPVLNAMRKVDNPIVDDSLQFHPADLAKARKMIIAPVSGLGFGCILIRREALEQIPFSNSEDTYPDTPFAWDCCKAGIRQVARFDVSCGHVRDDGLILWPDIDPEQFVSIECKILQPFNGNINGESRHYEVGQVVKIPVDSAVQFLRAGYLTYTLRFPDTVNGRKVYANG